MSPAAAGLLNVLSVRAHIVPVVQYARTVCLLPVGLLTVRLSVRLSSVIPVIRLLFGPYYLLHPFAVAIFKIFKRCGDVDSMFKHRNDPNQVNKSEQLQPTPYQTNIMVDNLLSDEAYACFFPE